MKKLILTVLFGSLHVFANSAQISSIEEIKSTIEQAETFEEKATVCIQFSKELFAKDLELSIEIAADAVLYAKRSGDSLILIRAYNNVGNLSRLEGNLQLANQYYRAALEIAEETDNNRYQGRIFFNIATCKLQLEDYEGAEADLLESEKMMLSAALSEGKTHLKVAEFLALQNNKALIEVGKGNNLKATQLYQVILDSISGKNEYLGNEFQALMGMGDALLKDGQYEESTKKYQRGLDLAQTKGNDLFRATFNYGLAKAFAELGQVERALDYGNTAFRKGQELKSSSILSHVTKLIGEFYERQAQPDSALYYSKLSDDYESAMQLPDARVELTADELNRKFKEREAILNQEWSQKKRSYMGWILGLVGFSILGFYFYIRNRIRLNQTEIERMKLKLANEKEQLEKEVLLTNITPGKIFLNLSLLIGLLQMIGG
jgi:tetratricopeptide (TPR) repeat protein